MAPEERDSCMPIQDGYVSEKAKCYHRETLSQRCTGHLHTILATYQRILNNFKIKIQKLPTGVNSQRGQRVEYRMEWFGGNRLLKLCLGESRLLGRTDCATFCSWHGAMKKV